MSQAVPPGSVNPAPINIPELPPATVPLDLVHDLLIVSQGNIARNVPVGELVPESTLVVSDGTTDVTNVDRVNFTSNATVTSSGAGIADVEINNGGTTAATLVVTDGTTDVLNVGTINFTSGGTVSSPGAGIADIEINGGTTVSTLTVSDGTTTVNDVTNLTFLTGATVSDGGAGEADVTIPPTDSVRMQIQWVSGAAVEDGTIWFCFDPPYDGIINSMTYFTANDSFTVAVKISGTNVTGLSAVTVNSATPATSNATAAKTFTAGQPVTGVISGTTGSPTDALLSLDVTWT